MRYAAASLHLLPEDNVDALEVQVPETAFLTLLLVGAAVAVHRRR